MFKSLRKYWKPVDSIAKTPVSEEHIWHICAKFEVCFREKKSCNFAFFFHIVIHFEGTIVLRTKPFEILSITLKNTNLVVSIMSNDYYFFPIRLFRNYRLFCKKLTGVFWAIKKYCVLMKEQFFPKPFLLNQSSTYRFFINRYAVLFTGNFFFTFLRQKSCWKNNSEGIFHNL